MRKLKTTHFKVRATERECRAFDAAAGKMGLSRSAWVRLTLHAAAQPEIATASKVRP